MYKKNTCLLSIVLPTYERIEGLEMLLLNIDIDLLKDGVIELVVTDDSLTDLVESYCNVNEYLLYTRHKNTKNPVDNWNNGLKIAQGRYVQVLHHDEYPASHFTYNQIVSSLEEKEYSVIIPRCYFLEGNQEPVKRIMQSFIAQRFALFFPYFLLGFNVIGSPSLFIYRNKGELFNPELTYLVDVNFYFNKIIKPHVRSNILLSESAFLSDTLFLNSITNSLGEKLGSTTLMEQNYILSRNGQSFSERILMKFVFMFRNFVNKVRH